MPADRPQQKLNDTSKNQSEDICMINHVVLSDWLQPGNAVA